MNAVNMQEAKSRLSALVEAVESGREAEVVIARDGKPAARLVPVAVRDTSKRIGIADGRYRVPEDIDEYEDEIIHMFDGDDPAPDGRA